MNRITGIRIGGTRVPTQVLSKQTSLAHGYPRVYTLLSKPSQYLMPAVYRDDDGGLGHLRSDRRLEGDVSSLAMFIRACQGLVCCGLRHSGGGDFRRTHFFYLNHASYRYKRRSLRVGLPRMMHILIESQVFLSEFASRYQCFQLSPIIVVRSRRQYSMSAGILAETCFCSVVSTALVKISSCRPFRLKWPGYACMCSTRLSDETVICTSRSLSHQIAFFRFQRGYSPFCHTFSFFLTRLCAFFCYTFFSRFCRATGREDEEGRGAPRRAAHGDELQGHEAKSAGSQGRPTGSVQVEKGAISLGCRFELSVDHV